jgi:hypothetical protein
MKKLLLLLISVLLLTLITGCKEENNDYKLKDLYGEWQITHQAHPDYTDGWVDITKDYYSVELRKNGAFYFEKNGYVESGIYELKGNTLYGELYYLVMNERMDTSFVKCEIQELDLKKDMAELDVYFIKGNGEWGYFSSVKAKRK